jgi:hypothetical protein
LYAGRGRYKQFPIAQDCPMLLSLSRKFIFVANLKSASSTIESSIGNKVEVRISQTRLGKHDSLSLISQKFSWVRRYVPYEEFFVFGVMRDPVDFVLSLYNSHQKDNFDGKSHSTKGVAFDRFLKEWCARSWQAKPQSLRFADEHGRFRLSHLIDLADLETEFPKICARLGLEGAALGRVNPSPVVLTRAELRPDQVELIQTRYREDYEFLRNRPVAV